jgi:hypothetical protein
VHPCNIEARVFGFIGGLPDGYAVTDKRIRRPIRIALAQAFLTAFMRTGATDKHSELLTVLSLLHANALEFDLQHARNFLWIAKTFARNVGIIPSVESFQNLGFKVAQIDFDAVPDAVPE